MRRECGVNSHRLVFRLNIHENSCIYFIDWPFIYCYPLFSLTGAFLRSIPPVERYSPADGTWTTCSYMRCPRENAGCCVYLGHIYVGGGKDQLSLQLCAMERFDPETMTWSPVKHMRSKRDSVSNDVHRWQHSLLGSWHKRTWERKGRRGWGGYRKEKKDSNGQDKKRGTV